MIPEIEKAKPEIIKAFQEEKLRETISYVFERSPFYQKLFAEDAIKPQDIQTLEDLKKIPVTTKTDLQRHNDDFICVPNSQLIDYVTTSGTLGDPVTFALTDKDLDRLAYNEAVSLACSGVESSHVLQLMTTMDRRFMAGLAYFMGARKLGAGIIRVGAGVPELQWDSILKFKPDYLISVPSFLLKLIDYAKTNGIELENVSVKGVICIGEPVRNEDFSLNTLAQKITSQWPIQLYSTYASTEMNTAFAECNAQQGGHHHPELIIVELLDENNQEVPENEVGELTVTTLGLEGMPLLRFKTGDMVRAHKEPCSCGRNTLRLGPVVGRKNHMIKYKGTTLYPQAIYNALNGFEEIKNYQIEISSNALGIDEILVRVATEIRSEELLVSIKDHIRAKLRVTPKLEFIDASTLLKLQFPEGQRKPVMLVYKEG
ncbi:phenylacetate--CoA ligase family protein [Algoriphagus chordae]|uniref:Phenylacetate-CoA ligase n=1 Tax=Algoriphagus chordae TaxID=237019 RepID=A0A2W7QK21_9BACT|nr:AMP-binding protein [Algoriphagus chordae]PZX48713.1 phenylacetate-CoA ligase [Algoriphagus chordae]